MIKPQDIIDILRGKKSLKKINGQNNTIILPSKKKDINLKINGSDNYIKLAKKSIIELNIFGDNNKVVFDDDITGFGVKIYIGTPDNTVNNCILTVGKNSTSNGTAIRIMEDNTNISIGENCMFSANVELMASDTHAITDLSGNLLNLGKEIFIGNNVWLGRDVMILKNSSIPDNCVIGARSVVAGNFNDKNCILAGIPAKIIKRDIVWYRMRPKQYLSQQQHSCDNVTM